jgi:hypothetical protein
MGFTAMTRTRTRRERNGNVSEWLSAVDGLTDVHARNDNHEPTSIGRELERVAPIPVEVFQPGDGAVRRWSARRQARLVRQRRQIVA